MTPEPSQSRPPFHSPPTNASCCRAPSRPCRRSSFPSSATWRRCVALRSLPTHSTRPNWSVGFATYMMAKRPFSSAWRLQSRRKIASSPLIAITVLSSIFFSLLVWNFVELFGLLRFSRFMGCWKLFGIFWAVHALVYGDFSCSYICKSSLDGGKEIVAGLRIIDQQSPSPPLKKEKKRKKKRKYYLFLFLSLLLKSEIMLCVNYWWIWIVFDGKTEWKENMAKIPVEVGETFNAYLNLIFFELLLVY